MIKFAALISAALAIAPAATALEVVEVGKWSVYPTPEGCVAAAFYDERDTGDRISLSVIYYPLTKKAVVRFSSTTATSVPKGTRMKMKIFLHIPNSEDDNEWTAEFTTSVKDDVRFFVSEQLDKSVLDDLAYASGVSFLPERVHISSFSLKGFEPAKAELKKCAFENVGLHPHDPFYK